MDLGFKFTNNLDPRPHIEMISCPALKMLDFIIRLFKDIGLKSFFKALYCYFVQLILEYGALLPLLVLINLERSSKDLSDLLATF